MRRICLVLLLLSVAAACEKQGAEPASPKGGGQPAASKPKPSAEPADEQIVPPPDKPGYAKPE